MWRAHKARFCFAGLVKLIHDIIMFLGPLILEQLLRFLDSEQPLCKYLPVAPPYSCLIFGRLWCKVLGLGSFAT